MVRKASPRAVVGVTKGSVRLVPVQDSFGLSVNYNNY